MARPKMSVAVALGRDRPGAGATEREVIRSTGRVGEKQPVNLEDGRVVYMRAKKAASHEEQSGVEDCGVEHMEDDVVRLETNCKQMPPLGVGSSSVNKQRTEEDLAPPASNQNLAADDGVHTARNCATPQARPQGTQNFGKREGGAEAGFKCTACGNSVAITNVRAHPVLHVGVCDACYEFLFSSPFTKDNPLDPSEHENECRWCGDGGEIVLCDTCPKAFCKPCIQRNFGADILIAIESPTRQWHCFVCDDNLLHILIRDYENVEKLAKTMNRNGQAQERRKSSEYRPRMRSRGRSINKTTSPDDTIATIINREKANMQRKDPETHFTGFEVKRQRHPQKNRHSLSARGILKRMRMPKHGTFKRGAPIPEVHL